MNNMETTLYIFFFLFFVLKNVYRAYILQAPYSQVQQTLRAHYAPGILYPCTVDSEINRTISFW